jgi:hypothetical protein
MPRLYAVKVEFQKDGTKYWLSSSFTVRASNVPAAVGKAIRQAKEGAAGWREPIGAEFKVSIKVC